MAAIGRRSEIDATPSFVPVWNRLRVIVETVVVFIEKIDRGIDESRLDERCARAMRELFLVKIAHHGCAAGYERIRHRRAAHVFVGLVEREPPSVVLIRTVLR